MFTVLRKIRRSLINENRISKYLLYAIGEIVLVVIGIMIALSLNNRNAEGQNRNKEVLLLAEMRRNLEADLSDCRYNINFCQRIHRGCTAVLKHLEEATPFHDSLKIHYGNVMGSTVLTANTSAFDNLKSIGFDLIQNDSLRRSITKLYSERYPYLNKVEQGYFQHLQITDMGPHVYEKLIVDTLWVSAYPINLELLQKDNAFKGVLRMNVFTCNYLARIYRGFENQITGLMELIDLELESRTP